MMHPIIDSILRPKWAYFGLQVLVCSLSFFYSETVRAQDFKITAVDSNPGYIGRERHIFFNVIGDQNEYLSSLQQKDVSLKVNGEPFANFQVAARKQLYHLTTAILVDSTAITPQALELVKASIKPYLSQKQGQDRILLNSNHPTSASKEFAQTIPDLDTQLSLIKFTPSPPQAIAKFIFDNVKIFPIADNRRWVITISSAHAFTQKYDDQEWEPLKIFLTTRKITPIHLLIESHASQSLLDSITQKTGGVAYTLKDLEELPKFLQKISAMQQSEYVLSYYLNLIGNKTHEVELKIQFGEESKVQQSDVTVVPIWPLSDSSFPLSGSLMILFAALAFIAWQVRDRKYLLFSHPEPGFQVLTPGEEDQFIALEAKNYTLDFLSEIKTKGGLRLSANLNKVTMVPHQGTFLLEDKNYKNALLINRRRIHRILLKNGDILDIGELTLLYRNENYQPTSIIGEDGNADEELTPIQSKKLKGPVRKDIPVLIAEKNKQENYLIKNITFIGSSSINDIVLKHPQVASKHAKIVRIGGQYKIQTMSTQEGTFVNNRRIEQRFLRDGDEISIGEYSFKFRMARTPSK
ncbi:FHA domain-containing protein [Deltaproteobacteria bacterium TL4]